MSPFDDLEAALESAADRLPLVETPAGVVIAAVTALALLARLVLLGDRIAHFDEARVGYWVLHYADTGSFAYRADIHGPFLPIVDRIVFSLLGANDFTARLPVALVGGLLPLSVYLFREHLRRLELVLLAGLLAFNPVLLYYSRFMRGDVLLGAFMFVALGFLVRFYDARRVRYLYGVAAFVALGFAVKENAVLYLLTWLGAGALLVDGGLYRPRNYPSGFDHALTKAGWLGEKARGVSERPVAFLRGYPLHLLGALAVFGAVSLYFYAPRGQGLPGLYVSPPSGGGWIGFWEAIFNPSKFPAMLGRTIDNTVSQYEYWIGQGGTPPRLKTAAARNPRLTPPYVEQLANSPNLRHLASRVMDLVVAAYLLTLGEFSKILAFKAPALTAFGLLGILHERYAVEDSRNLVTFATYAAIASLLGYALGADVAGPWLLAHVVLPLSIPAAVGLGRAIDWGVSAVDTDDEVSLALFAILVLVVGGGVAATAVTSVYVNDQVASNHLVQYAQPTGEMRPTLQELERASTQHESGPDAVVYSGSGWNASLQNSILVRQSTTRQPDDLAYRPACVRWFNTLPMPWYFELYDTSVDCTRSPTDLANRVQGESPPPVVITAFEDPTVPREVLRQSYTPYTHRLRATHTLRPLSEPAPSERRVTFWVHEDWTNSGGARARADGR